MEIEEEDKDDKGNREIGKKKKICKNLENFDYVEKRKIYKNNKKDKNYQYLLILKIKNKLK